MLHVGLYYLQGKDTEDTEDDTDENELPHQHIKKFQVKLIYLKKSAS